MADLAPCNPKAQSRLTDAAGNEGGDADPHHPHEEGNIIDEQTPTPSGTGILTPVSSVGSAGLTGVSASQQADSVVDCPVRLDSRPQDLSLAGTALLVTSAPEPPQGALLINDDVSSLEIASGLVHTIRAENSSSAVELGSSSAFLSSSNDDQGGNREDYHGEILMAAFMDDVRQGLPFRLQDPNHASIIAEALRRVVVAPGIAAATVHGAVPPSSPYPSEIEEILEQLR